MNKMLIVSILFVFAVISLSARADVNSDLVADLEAYFLFDNSLDSEINGYTLTSQGSSYNASGFDNECLWFDTSTANANMSWSPAVDETYCWRMKQPAIPTAGNPAMLFWAKEDLGMYGWVAGDDQREPWLRFNSVDQANIYGDTALSMTNWNTICAIINTSGNYVYLFQNNSVNTIYQGDTTAGNNYWTQVVLGQWSGYASTAYQSCYDDFMIFSRDLTTQEMSWLCSNRITLNASNATNATNTTINITFPTNYNNTGLLYLGEYTTDFYVDVSPEINYSALNVNSSDYWDNLTNASDLYIFWANILNIPDYVKDWSNDFLSINISITDNTTLWSMFANITNIMNNETVENMIIDNSINNATLWSMFANITNIMNNETLFSLFANNSGINNNATLWSMFMNISGGTFTNDVAIDGEITADNFYTLSNNVYAGTEAGSGDIGDYNSGLGYRAFSGTEGNESAGLGFYAGYQSSGNSGSYFGQEAGRENNGTHGSFLGYQSGYGNSGNYNTGFGARTLQNAFNDYIVAVGYQAGYATNSKYSHFIGYRAGYEANGGYNVGIGRTSLIQTTATGGTSVGDYSGAYNKGDYLVSLGVESGYKNDGSYNIFAGRQSGYYNNATQAIGLGYRAGYGNTYDYVIMLGSYSNATANKQFTVGSENSNAEITDLRIGVNNDNNFPIIYGDSTGIGLGTTHTIGRLTIGDLYNFSEINTVRQYSNSSTLWGFGTQHSIYDTQPYNNPDTSVGIMFGSRYNSGGSLTIGAGISAEKEGEANSYYGYALKFLTRAHGTSGSEKMRIEGSGNVGIGTSNPDYNLHVYDSTGASVIKANSGSSGSYGAFKPESDGGNGWFISRGTTATGNVFDYPSKDTTNLYSVNQALLLGTYNDDPIVFGQNSDEAMRIDTNGDLTINNSLFIGNNYIDDQITFKSYWKVGSTGALVYVYYVSNAGTAFDCDDFCGNLEGEVYTCNNADDVTTLLTDTTQCSDSNINDKYCECDTSL